MRSWRQRSVVALGLIAAQLAPAGAQTAPRPPRPLEPIATTAADRFSTVANVRGLPDGRALVLDVVGRKLVFVDAALATVRVVADSSSATGNAFGGRIGGLMPYLGDSSLFLTTNNPSVLIIDADGRIARVAALPRPGMAYGLVGGALGFSGLDAKQRFVIRGAPGRPALKPCNRDGSRPLPTWPDTAPLIRIDPATKGTDTVAMLRIPLDHIFEVAPFELDLAIDPLPRGDDWAVLSSGAVVVVRVLDYHAEVFSADGARKVGPRVPFEWRRLSDADKAAFVDSARTSLARLDTSVTIDVIERMPTSILSEALGACAPGSEAAPPRLPPAPAPGFVPPKPKKWITGAELLPDYRPPFVPGSTRADMENNVWVRTSVAVGGRPVYDVIDGNGRPVDHLSIPPGRVIVGFGPRGAVYMAVRDGAGTRLELARWRKP